MATSDSAHAEHSPCDNLRFAFPVVAMKGMPFLKATRKFVDYEGSVGEEYVTLMHSLLSDEEGDATVKKILEYIARDEERPEEILKLAIEVP